MFTSVEILKEHIHWKDVALATIIVLQGIIGFMWYDMKQEIENNHAGIASVETRVDGLEVFRASTEANRFTAGDASQMQLVFIRELQAMREQIGDDISRLRSCFNTNLVQGRKEVCQ